MTGAKSFISASADFASGKSSPRDFLEQNLAAIDAREDEIEAFVVRLDPAIARARADEASKRWRNGDQRSAIDGMPIGIKDVIETIDMPTGMGSPLYDNWRGDKDSASVWALRNSGAIVIGKTVTTEFAASHPGPTRNPHDLARTPGGSSSGSAAGVAAGFFAAGLGTQVVGSILRPASYCGVVGFKPTFGAINRGGSHDYMSQSSQGVLAASLNDAWSTLAAIAIRVGGDPGYPGLEGPLTLPQARAPKTLIVLETPGWAIASEQARAAFEGAKARLAQAGVKLATRRERPEIDAFEHMLMRALPLTRLINAWESLWPLNTYADRDASKLSAVMRERAIEGTQLKIGDYRAALAERASIRAAFASLAQIGEACVTLSAPGPAPLGLTSTGDPSFAIAASVLGAPALSLPMLQDSDLPLGLQVLGFDGADADVFAIGASVQGM
jgi:Asp-tRNA(Asn)/Glu-tRNA(Gln) amidotransferase A subunit family amidase